MTGTSQVLNIGRASRVWPKPIRKALQLEDHGCGWPDCQTPLWACRIHPRDMTVTRRGVSPSYRVLGKINVART